MTFVSRARGRNKRKPTKTSELPHLFHFQRHTPTSTAFVKTALFPFGGPLGWVREKGESAQLARFTRLKRMALAHLPVLKKGALRQIGHLKKIIVVGDIVFVREVSQKQR